MKSASGKGLKLIKGIEQVGVLLLGQRGQVEQLVRVALHDAEREDLDAVGLEARR